MGTGTHHITLRGRYGSSYENFQAPIRGHANTDTVTDDGNYGSGYGSGYGYSYGSSYGNSYGRVTGATRDRGKETEFSVTRINTSCIFRLI